MDLYKKLRGRRNELQNKPCRYKRLDADATGEMITVHVLINTKITYLKNHTFDNRVDKLVLLLFATNNIYQQ